VLEAGDEERLTRTYARWVNVWTFFVVLSAFIVAKVVEVTTEELELRLIKLGHNVVPFFVYSTYIMLLTWFVNPLIHFF